MFNDIAFDLMLFAPMIIAIAITLVALYFIVKFAVKKALENYFGPKK